MAGKPFLYSFQPYQTQHLYTIHCTLCVGCLVLVFVSTLKVGFCWLLLSCRENTCVCLHTLTSFTLVTAWCIGCLLLAFVGFYCPVVTTLVFVYTPLPLTLTQILNPWSWRFETLLPLPLTLTLNPWSWWFESLCIYICWTLSCFSALRSLPLTKWMCLRLSSLI